MAMEIADGLWHVDCRTRDRPNVYLVNDGGWTLVDAGWPGDERTVREGFRRANCRPEDVDRVLLTHYDADHVGTLGRLTPELTAPVYVHQVEAPYVAGERLPPWTARNGLEAIHRLYYRRIELPDLPIRRIEDGEEIGGFRACHTPGHTPGHVVYVHEGLGAAFLGDLAWEWRGRLRPADRVTSYDRSRALASIRSLLEGLPDLEYLCPGHGRPLRGGRRALEQLVD